MTDNNSAPIGIGTILFMVVAYFIYGNSISAALGMLLLVIASGLTALLSLIPFAGAMVAYLLNTTYVYPAVMTFTGLTPTWLTSLLLFLHTVIGIVITIITSYLTIKLFNK